MNRVGLILLAAGASSRMGTPKQLLPYRRKSLLRHAAETALESACRPVIVVLGANAAAVRPALGGLEVQIVENGQWAGGMGTSIRCGVAAAMQQRLDSVILALADQPSITPEIYNRLLTLHADSGRPIVTSEYAGTVGVPVLFSSEFFAQLMALQPAQGCKGVILANSALAYRLPCPEAELDIDTPQDYEAALG